MPPKTKIVGIVNVTPDSFSDGGAHLKPDDALRAIAQQAKEGADVIDIGAESTRPGATPISSQEEWQRLEPVLQKIKPGLQFSIDTRHAVTAQRALKAGAHWINDVSGFVDPAMVEAVKSSGCMLVVMHSLSVPADKSVVIPDSQDVVQALLQFAEQRIRELEKAGIARTRIIFDPGIGFGKTPPQSLAILRGIQQFRALNVPILIGHSRKSFLAGLSPDRNEATLAVSQYLAEHGVDYIRVHEVARHRQMLKLLGALSDG